MYALPHPVGHEVEVPPDGVVHRNCNIRLHIDVRHGQVVSGGADTSEMVSCDKRGMVLLSFLIYVTTNSDRWFC